MAEYLIQDTTLTNIADAIRSKTGGTDAIKVSDMANQIQGITGGGSGGVSHAFCRINKASEGYLALGGSSGSYGYSALVPKDATEVCGFLSITKVIAVNNSNATIANLDDQKVVLTPDAKYTDNGNGYKTVSLGPLSLNYTGAYGFKGDNTVLVSYRMPNVRIENNFLYANADCEGVFSNHPNTDRSIITYLEGIDLRGSKVQYIPDRAVCSISELKKVWLSECMTELRQYAFYKCDGLEEVHFTSATPPTLQSTTSFGNLPATCKIYVPKGTLAAYTSAKNYPSSSTYTYVEE